MEGDADVLRGVAQAALEELPQLVSGLERALGEQNAELVSRLAHTIKGTLKLFGCEQVSELARSIEQFGRDGKLNEVSPVLVQLRAGIERFCTALSVHIDAPND